MLWHVLVSVAIVEAIICVLPFALTGLILLLRFHFRLCSIELAVNIIDLVFGGFALPFATLLVPDPPAAKFVEASHYSPPGF
jgi:hypothetical protein